MKALVAFRGDTTHDQRRAGPILERRRVGPLAGPQGALRAHPGALYWPLADRAAISGADRVIDMGCGTGSTTRAAAEWLPRGTPWAWTRRRRCSARRSARPAKTV